MEDLRANDTKQGPLKIIKLPTSTMPFALSEVTPKTLAEMGLFHKTNKRLEQERQTDRLLSSLEFHDVNEEYEEAKRVNHITEMKVIASSKHMSKLSIDSGSIHQTATNRTLADGNYPNSKRDQYGNNILVDFENNNDFPMPVKHSEGKKQVEKDLRDTPLKVLWKKNGKVYNAKKVELGSFEPYLGGAAKPRTDRAKRLIEFH